MPPYSTCKYSEYRRTSGVETGITAAARTFARAPLALSALGTMCTSRVRETKPACRSPSAWPTRTPGLGQQRQQEAVQQVLTGHQDRHDLPRFQGVRAAVPAASAATFASTA